MTKNIQIVLNSDYLNNSDDHFSMHFNFEENEEKEIRITTTNAKDQSQHDFAITKEDYLFLREQFDKHFEIETVAARED